MPDTPPRPARDDEVSLLAIGDVAIRNRWRIARWVVTGAVIAILPVLFDPPTYTATASFIPQSRQDPARAGLASLAGQFGMQLGGGGSLGQSPDFYVSLLHSRSILGSIAKDTFTVAEKGGVLTTLADLLEIKESNPARREELAVEVVDGLIVPKIDTKTGVVSVSVTTPWPTISAAVANRLVSAVNRFNMQTRRGQAGEERRSTETLLGDARAALLLAEERMKEFLQRNAQFGGSPQLKFDHDRLQREVSRHEVVVTSLAQAFDEVRIREARDTPVITVIEAPVPPTRPNARGRLQRGLGGVFAGAFVALLIAFVSESMRKRQTMNDPDAQAFQRSLGEVKTELGRFIPGRRKAGVT